MIERRGVRAPSDRPTASTDASVGRSVSPPTCTGGLSITPAILTIVTWTRTPYQHVSVCKCQHTYVSMSAYICQHISECQHTYVSMSAWPESTCTCGRPVHHACDLDDCYLHQEGGARVQGVSIPGFSEEDDTHMSAFCQHWRQVCAGRSVSRPTCAGGLSITPAILTIVTCIRAEALGSRVAHAVVSACACQPEIFLPRKEDLRLQGYLAHEKRPPP